MSINLTEINLSIIGKPNSGKSTLFNTLLGKNVSPVGDEYGLTKRLYSQDFKFNNYNFKIIDTPGLRRKNKIIQKDEIIRNSKVLKLINKVEIVVLLIDSLESITRQDLKLADLSINKNKIIFFLFNKIDIIEDKKKYKLDIKRYLKNRYSKFKMINADFISAKKNIRIEYLLNQIIKKRKLLSIKIEKKEINKFIDYLNKKSTFPKVNKIEIKPKYIVQVRNKVPKFKVFINSKKRTPQIFQKYFDNIFREYFKLDGVPVIYEYISSKNPYTN